MSDLTGGERRKLEKLLGMRGGFVLDFSDRTFSEFFDDYRIKIGAGQYRTGGHSKANRMRMFWSKDPNQVVGRVIEGLVQRRIDDHSLPNDATLIDDCRKIAQRLLSGQSVPEIDAITAIADERDFEVVAKHAREAIGRNEPQEALDRLHTFVIKYVRTICDAHSIEVSRDMPLHSIFGKYVKFLREGKHLESEMTERILKASISVFEAFNHVRNNQSLAHDNAILNYEESLLIFNHVAATIRFIKALEAGIKSDRGGGHNG